MCIYIYLCIMYVYTISTYNLYVRVNTCTFQSFEIIYFVMFATFLCKYLYVCYSKSNKLQVRKNYFERLKLYKVEQNN